jgi:hypothetical protein
MPVKEAERLQALRKVTKGSSYKEHIDELTCEPMVEYHVNACKEFMERKNNESEFGSDLSVQHD